MSDYINVTLTDIKKELHEIRDEQKKIGEYIAKTEERLRMGNEKFQFVEHEISELRNRGCKVCAGKYDDTIEFYHDFKSVLGNIIDEFQERKARKKEIDKQVIINIVRWIVTGILGLVGGYGVMNIINNLVKP